jgi:thioredoxin 1
MEIVYVNKDTYQEEVKKEKITLMVFYADWCSPCKLYHKNLEELSKEGKKIIKINSDENSDILKKFNISSIPASVMYCDGKPSEVISGYISLDDLRDWFRIHSEVTFDENSLKDL